MEKPSIPAKKLTRLSDLLVAMDPSGESGREEISRALRFLIEEIEGGEPCTSSTYDLAKTLFKMAMTNHSQCQSEVWEIDAAQASPLWIREAFASRLACFPNDKSIVLLVLGLREASIGWHPANRKQALRANEETMELMDLMALDWHRKHQHPISLIHF